MDTPFWVDQSLQDPLPLAFDQSNIDDWKLDRIEKCQVWNYLDFGDFRSRDNLGQPLIQCFPGLRQAVAAACKSSVRQVGFFKINHIKIQD